MNSTKTIMKTAAALVCTAALALTSTAAYAAPPNRATTTITFDADGTTLPVAEAAADWSKNTDIRVVTGDCTGAGCVHFKIIENAIPCDYGRFINGCAYPLADGSCQVEVYYGILGRANLEALVTKHEAGHCILWFGGRAVNYHMPDTPHALMSSTHSGSPSRKEATLTSHDREFTRSLF